jgi:hypothetical protein
MKIPIIILFLAVILVPATIGISFGQSSGAISEDESEFTGAIGEKIPRDRKEIMENPPDILLQLVLRNSDGNLLAYTETKEIMAMRPLYLMDYLDDITNKKIIIKKGKQLELIQFERPEPNIIKRHSTAMYALMAWVDEENKILPILWMNHEAIQVDSGDTMKVYWTIIR